MTPDLDELYAVLRQWTIEGRPQTYGALSRAYYARTRRRVAPRGWGAPLGKLNNRLYAAIRAPALSALVIRQDTKQPGALFWDVPDRLQSDSVRRSKWKRILKKVLAYPWPPTLPP
jgi:hypothetical protein